MKGRPAEVMSFQGNALTVRKLPVQDASGTPLRLSAKTRFLIHPDGFVEITDLEVTLTPLEEDD